MARNLNDLAASLELKAKNIKVVGSKLAIQMATTTLQALLERTPVDTSAAVSNWQVSLNSIKTNFIDPYVPGYLGYTALASAREALRVGTAELEKKKPGQTIYIVNNTPYIRDLNSGTSKQAPAGFVEAAVFLARKRKAKLDI